MRDYIEYNDTIVFHPGYYINKIMEEKNLTQKDFSKQLGMTLEDLWLLTQGEKNIYVDNAKALSGAFGTSVEYWLNLQTEFDALVSRKEN